jgi:hypothetical protein
VGTKGMRRDREEKREGEGRDGEERGREKSERGGSGKVEDGFSPPPQT